MISYKDREFCSAGCRNTRCDRRLTPEVIADATAWSASFGVDHAMISQRDRSGDCAAFIPNLEPTDAGA